MNCQSPFCPLLGLVLHSATFIPYSSGAASHGQLCQNSVYQPGTARSVFTLPICLAYVESIHNEVCRIKTILAKCSCAGAGFRRWPTAVIDVVLGKGFWQNQQHSLVYLLHHMPSWQVSLLTFGWLPCCCSYWLYVCSIACRGSCPHPLALK